MDILYGVRLNDDKRTGALDYIQCTTLNDFANDFGGTLDDGELNEAGLIPTNMREAVEAVKKNATLILLNLAPEQLRGTDEEVTKAWMIHVWNKIKHGMLVVTAEHEGTPVRSSRLYRGRPVFRRA